MQHDITEGHKGKWSKPGTDRQILYDPTYIWNLKKSQIIETESSLVLPRVWEYKKCGDIGETVQCFSYAGWMNSRDLMYSIVSITKIFILNTWSLLRE